MGNFFQNNTNEIKINLSQSEYWDTYLSKDTDQSYILDGSKLYDENLISLIDLNNFACISGDTLYGSISYIYPNAVNSGLTLNNVGLTGVDNGLILFDKDIITNEQFKNIVENSTLNINENDKRLILTTVSGNTGNYIYPTNIISGNTEQVLRLDGGFYQGFYKSGDNYVILPNNIVDEITFDFILKPDFISEPLVNTLNYNHPNNKGFFFYIGTRSENKFWYSYAKDNNESFDIVSTGITYNWYSGDTISTENGFDVGLQNTYDIATDNKFLLFNRSGGLTVNTFNQNTEYHISGITTENINNFSNLNRTSTGYTYQTINLLDENVVKYNLINDIVGNAIGFRIKDDGSIGYRVINSSCISGYTVDEEYSVSGITKDAIKSNIVVRLIMSKQSECGDENRTFKLYFYVDSKLVLVSKSLPELLFKELNDSIEKQETIPYNISLGGGTQGLSDMIGFDNSYSTTYMLPIEKYFAGSFIGEINKFRIFNGKYDFSKINNNYKFEFGDNVVYVYIEPTIDFTIRGLNITAPETNYIREKGNIGSGINSLIHVNKPLNKPSKPLTGYKLYYYPNNSTQTQLNGLFSINITGGTITEYEHNDIDLENLNSIKYMIEVFDTYRITTGTKKTQTVIFDNFIFYGSSPTIPTGSTDIRLLENRIFNNGASEVILNTGNINEIFVIAMPSTKVIESIIDETAFNIDITNTYLLHNFNVEDGGGNLTDYNIYIMKNAIPYSKNHIHKITLI